MFNAKWPAVLLLVLLAASLAACGGGEHSARLEPSALKPALPAQAPAGLPALPAPSLLPPRKGSSPPALDLRVEGSEFEPGLPHNNLAAVLTDAGYNPSGSGATLASAACGVYQFNTTGYSGDFALNILWSAIPPANAVFVGVANFTTNRWDWFNPQDVSFLSLGAFDPKYRNANGTTGVALVLTGNGPGTLNYLRIGDNRAPVPALTVTPPAGGTADAFKLEAGGSFDPDGSIANYGFIVEGNNIDNGTSAVLNNVHFSEAGDQFVVVTVTDDDGQQEQASQHVMVGASPVPVLNANPFTGNVSMMVDFSATGSSDADGSITKYEFDPENDGTFIDNGANPVLPTYSYTQAGFFNAALRVTDNDGHTASTATPIRVGWKHSIMGPGLGGTLNQTLLDSSGNCYVCGVYDNAATTSEDGLLIKYDPDGAVLWKRLQATPILTRHDSIGGIALDSSGALYVLGVSGGNPDQGDVYLAKLDPATAAISWQKTLVRNTGANIPTFGLGLAIDSQDRADIGFTFATGDHHEFVAAQFSSAGVLNWVTRWATPDDNKSRELSSVCVDPQDNVYLAGHGYVDTDGSQRDAVVISTDALGAQRWGVHVDTLIANVSQDEVLRGCCFSAGELYLTGEVDNVNTNDAKGLILGFDPSGGINLLKLYNPPVVSDEQGLGACTADSGSGIIINGEIKDPQGGVDALLMRMTSVGGLQLQRTYGLDMNSDRAYATPALGPDGAIYFVGSAASFDSVFNDVLGSLSEVPGSITSPITVGTPQSNDFVVAEAAVSFADFSPATTDGPGEFTMRYYP